MKVDSPGDAGLAGLPGGEVVGFLGFPQAGAVRAVADGKPGMRILSRDVARARSGQGPAGQGESRDGVGAEPGLKLASRPRVMSVGTRLVDAPELTPVK